MTYLFQRALWLGELVGVVTLGVWESVERLTKRHS